MIRCRAIVFDLDGTLVDSYRPITAALNAARAAFGLPPVALEWVRRAVGHGLEQLIEDNLGRDRVAQGVAVFRETYARIFREGTRPLPGVPEAVATLAGRGIQLGVASNKPARFSREILLQVGLQPFIREVLGPGEGIPPKPEPAMITRVREALGALAHETLYVGDMALDVESARRAGVACVLLPTGSAGRQDLELFEGIPVLDGLADLASRVFPQDPLDPGRKLKYSLIPGCPAE